MALLVKGINSDAVPYITSAQEFAAGHIKEGLTIFRMPFYPFLIALFHSIIPNWVVAGRLVSLLTSVLTIIPLYLLAKELFDRKAALWACVAFAISPLPNHLSIEVVRDPAYVFFFAWSIYFAYDAVHSKRVWFFFIAGIFSCFAFLSRLEGVILFPYFIVFFVYIALKNKSERKLIFKGILLYLLSPFLFFSLCFLVLQSQDRFFYARIKHFNRFSYIKNHFIDLLNREFLQNYKMIYAKLADLEKTLPYRRGGLHFTEIARHHMYAVYFIGLLESFIKALFPPSVIPLGFSLKNSRIRNHAFIVFLLGCYLLFLYCSLLKRDVMRERHLLAPALLLYPWVGVGLNRMVNYFRKGTWKRWLTVGFIIVMALVSIYRSIDIVWKQDDVVARAGQWIGNRRALEGAAIITTDRRIPFYAGRGSDYVRYDGSDYGAMEKIASEKGYDVLVIRTSKKRRKSGPQLAMYNKVKEFVGVKDIVSVYISPNFRSTVGRKNRG
jgi:4-amino-4-deoxy-L-arabinose transferase-like glycosyltransferase